MPAKTIGLGTRYPGRGSAAGAEARVIVSPTRHSCTVLNPVAMYPTSPEPRLCTGFMPGAKNPISTGFMSVLVIIMRSTSVGLIEPSITRM
jgi:hypothetical protein